jgi:phosphonate transport system ATP-binding protein
VAAPATRLATAPDVAAGDRPRLRVEGLVKRFRGSDPVLRGVGLSVLGGELVVVLGANGSGKSTLLRCVVRLLEPDEGVVWLGDRELTGLKKDELRLARRDAAMVFQQIYLVRRRTALENTMFGALGRIPARRSLSRRILPADVRGDALAALDRVGLVDRAAQRADTLSGGQAQRVAIARALCQRASVILADEPVASLDPHAADDVLALLADVAHREHLAVLCVLHQPELARRYADRLIGLHHGAVTFDSRPALVSDEQIAALYADERDGS